MFGPRRLRKTYAHYRQTLPAGSDINRGSSSTLGVVSTFGGIWPGLGRRRGRKDLHLEGGGQHQARAIIAKVSVRVLARENTSTGRSVASASCPPRTSARLMALTTWPGSSRRCCTSSAREATCSRANEASSRASYYVRKTAPPLAPMPRFLDCGTGAATRGNPAHGPTVPTEHIGHGSVSHGRRRDSRYGQKWAGSNGGSRRAEAAVESSAGSCPLLEQLGSPLPRREDDAPVFRPSNGSRNDRPTNHLSHRINFATGQATPLAGEAGDVSPPP
jgi:hypothetical protein